MGLFGLFKGKEHKEEIKKLNKGVQWSSNWMLNYEEIKTLFFGAWVEWMVRAYESSIICQRCVNIKKNEFMNEEIKIRRNGEEITNEEKEQINLLYGWKSFMDFKNLIYMMYSNFWYCIIEKEKNIKGEIISLRPVNMLEIKSFWFSKRNNVDFVELNSWEIITRENMIIFSKCDNLLYPDLWNSPLSWILTEILLCIVAQQTNVVYYWNNATPRTIITASKVWNEEVEQLRHVLKEDIKWSNNFHKTLLLASQDGTWWINQLAENWPTQSNDMIEKAITRIWNAYGIPRSLLNADSGVTYNNADNYYESFIEQIIVEEDVFVGELQKVIDEKFGKWVYELQASKDHNKNMAYYTDVYSKLIDMGVLSPFEVGRLLGIKNESISEEDKEKQKRLKI